MVRTGRNTKQKLIALITREYSKPQDRCEHDDRFNEPSRVGYVWKRCAHCGLVLEERPRCPGTNRDSTRCLIPIPDGYEQCYAHQKRTPVPDAFREAAR